MNRIFLWLISISLIAFSINFINILEVVKIIKTKDVSRYEIAFLSLDNFEKNSDINATYLLGLAYKDGLLGEKNLEKSHNYFLKAAALGDKDAMLIVGWNFYKGIGCKRDLKSARFWLEKLAILGDENALEMISFLN